MSWYTIEQAGHQITPGIDSVIVNRPWESPGESWRRFIATPSFDMDGNLESWLREDGGFMPVYDDDEFMLFPEDKPSEETVAAHIKQSEHLASMEDRSLS